MLYLSYESVSWSPARQVIWSLMLGFVLALGSAAWGAEAGEPITGAAKTAFLTTWSARLRGMQSLHMLFRQEKHLPVLRRVLTAQGELWLKGERLRYTLANTSGETELAVSLDKQTIKTYYPALQTLEVIEAQMTGALPLMLPFWSPEPEAWLTEYEVELFQDTTGMHTLRLVPRNVSLPVQEMRLLLRDFQPQTFVQVEKNGTRVSLHITAFTVNPEVSEEQLTLRVPAGTKVLRPLQ
ncbi:MAG: outer membrane lipoprotein carrier protein LolA [Candidatus Tectimicrobiota bacterium]